MIDEKTDVDYYVLLAGISSCCEEGFRQGVQFMQTNIIPQKERLAKIEVLEEILALCDMLRFTGNIRARVLMSLAELKATK